MNNLNKCESTQNFIDQLIDTDAPINKEIQEHIDTCQACSTYFKASQNIDKGLAQMTESDAPDQLVDATLASILSMQDDIQNTHTLDDLEKKPPHKASSLLKPQWANALAASFMLVSLIALFPYNSISEYELFTSSEDTMSQAPVDNDSEVKRKRIKPNLDHLDPSIDSHSVDLIKLYEKDSYDADFRAMPSKPGAYAPSEPFSSYPYSLNEDIMESDDHSATLRKQAREEIAQAFERSNRQSLGVELKSKKIAPIIQKSIQKSIQKNELAGSTLNRTAPTYDETVTEELESITVTGSSIRSVDIQETENNASQISKDDHAIYDHSLLAQKKHEQPSTQSPQKPEKLIFGQSSVQSHLTFGQQYPDKKAASAAAQKYLTELQSLENITYQNATGYWSNSYIPGDSRMRLIHSKIIQNSAYDQEIIDAIQPNIQPFDKPTNASMALFLSSDHAAIENHQPKRMRLQVGLQASKRKSGHRPAMNIGVVFDPTEKTADYIDQIQQLKALLVALLNAKQSGDNITLTVTGKNGGVLINSHDFRHGPIQVALNQLSKEHKTESQSSTNLLQALQQATNATEKHHDSSSSLGTSMLLLISGKNNKDASLKAVEALIHDNSINGITLSTVSLNVENHKPLETLALTGQGHMQHLLSKDDAKRIIDEQLYASSGAVARALRLRIRLAKGVKLINVINAHNLNESQSQQVRSIEQSIDQQLSKNLGISSDRGQDEDGIQIVIPAFYADDTHVILLDVVATHAGAIADVSLKYKDLIYLKNAVSRKQLDLNSQPKTIGPLHINVIKNTLAQRFSRDMQLASQWLKNSNQTKALNVLLSLQEIYQGMQIKFPHWHSDAEIIKDQKLLEKYIDLLMTLSLPDTQQTSFIIDSLQYISWRKSITNPM